MSCPAERIVGETKAWLTRAVIGLNLCPFAGAVQAKDQIRYVVTEASSPDDLLAALHAELHHLAQADPAQVETTLLIHPHALTDFDAYNQFLADAEAAVEELGYLGVIQVASFHPDYQFAGTETDDITNATNRSPYPTLHLLREESIERALEGFPNPESIYETNIETMKKLGPDGWAAIRARCKKDAEGTGSDLPV